MPLARTKANKRQANGPGLFRLRGPVTRIPQVAPEKLRGLAGGQDDYFVGPVPPVDHMKALRVTTWLSRTARALWRDDALEIDPKDLIRVLNREGIKFVLMGAHAVAGWTRVERATRDVDVLVQKSHHRRAVSAVARKFPGFQREDNPAVTRFRDPSDGRVAIDVMKPTDTVHKAALRNSVLVRQSHHVPTLEMLLTCKFAAMTSPNREHNKKLIDAADFMLLIKHNREEINRVKLQALAENVYAGAGNELVRLVDDVIAGRQLVF